jgi:hypothetical protein
MSTSRVGSAPDAATGVDHPGEIFVSYSHEDDDCLERFLVMLKPLVRDKRLTVWADPYIAAGDVCRREIDDALERAGLGLLLVSPDFLASDFIMHEELRALVDREVRFVCVFVRPCLWREVPRLAGVQ